MMINQSWYKILISAIEDAGGRHDDYVEEQLENLAEYLAAINTQDRQDDGLDAREQPEDDTGQKEGCA
jgi:hypothetical protein